MNTSPVPGGEHPRRFDLELLAVGDLDEEQQSRIDEHLKGCTGCRERLWRVRQEQATARRAIPDQAPVEAFRMRRERERRRARLGIE